MFLWFHKTKESFPLFATLREQDIILSKQINSLFYSGERKNTQMLTKEVMEHASHLLLICKCALYVVLEAMKYLCTVFELHPVFFPLVDWQNYSGEGAYKNQFAVFVCKLIFSTNFTVSSSGRRTNTPVCRIKMVFPKSSSDKPVLNA